MSSSEVQDNGAPHTESGAPETVANGEVAEEVHGTDPGLKFLRDITLSAEEEADYTHQVKENVKGILAFANGAKEEGWNPVTKMFGVQVYSKSAGESGRMMCKGQTTMPADVTMKLLEDQFVRAFNTNKYLPMQMRASDPMSKETKILCQIPAKEDEFIRIVWGSFAAVGIAYARDFCFLQHATHETDPETGERIFIVVAGSIERPEVPDMEKLCRRIRSTVETSGYVFREKADGPIEATYVVNFNPNGWIPTKVVNTVAVSQALNASRVSKRIGDTNEALTAMGESSPVLAADLAWRATHTESIPRPGAGAEPVTVRISFRGNAKVSFRIQGAGGTAATEWKPAEAESLAGDGEWATYNKHEVVKVEFKLHPTEDGAGGENCTLEWKTGGWFKGLTIFYKLTVS